MSRDECAAASTTSRGFPAPMGKPEVCAHQRGERFYVIRLTKYERDLLRAQRSGVVGRFCLQSADDGTYELVRYSDD